MEIDNPNLKVLNIDKAMNSDRDPESKIDNIAYEKGIYS